MIYDEYITPEEQRLIATLKGKSRMEQDQIIFEYERTKENGNIVRNDSASKRTVRASSK